MPFILAIQRITTWVGILLLIALPALTISTGITPYLGLLFNVSFSAAFLVMTVRPLADILGYAWLRRLVILRKGFGILSASIIVGVLIGKIIMPGSNYFFLMLSPHFFSFENYAFFAHVGDITGIILLVTSNTLSQRFLKRNWKRIQRLSYVYFFASGIYEAFALENFLAYVALVVVTWFTVFAWLIKANR